MILKTVKLLGKTINMIIVNGADNSGEYITGSKSKGLYDDETKQTNVNISIKSNTFYCI